MISTSTFLPCTILGALGLHKGHGGLFYIRFGLGFNFGLGFGFGSFLSITSLNIVWTSQLVTDWGKAC